MRIPRFLTLTLSLFLALSALPLLSFALGPQADTDWTDASPDGGEWVSALPAQASITATDAEGLSDDAAYRYKPSDAGWTAWQTANLQIGEPVSTTRHITVTALALAQGLNFIQYRITDTLASVADSPALPINVDSQGPPSPIDAVAQPADWTNQNNFGAGWVNPGDANGIGGVWHKLGAAPVSADDGTFSAGENINSIGGVAVSGDGEHLLWLWLADKLGNADHASAVAVTLKLDTAPPGPLTDAAAAPAEWTNVNSFDLTWTPPADASDIAGVRYQLDAPPATAGDGDFWSGAVNGRAGYSIPGTANGEHQLWVWPVDGAGNAAVPGSAIAIPLKLDTTPPAPPLTVPDVTPDGWQTNPDATFSAAWTNPADPSGIAAACYKLGSEPAHNADGICTAGDNISAVTDIRPANPGSYHLFLWLQDQAGNIDKNSRRVALDAVQWDPTPPQILVNVSGTQGRNDWFLNTVDLSFIASDVGSGLDRVEYNLDLAGWTLGNQVRVQNDGFHNVSVRATDLAGNRTEIGPTPYNIDSTPPHTNLTFNRAPLYQDWYDGSVSVTFTPEDAASGPDYVEWKLDAAPWQRTHVAVVDADGEHAVQYFAADRAGQVEETQSLTINIDRFPPVTSYVILPGDAMDGWYTEPVTITLFPADDGAGVADTFFRINGGAWQSGTEFTLANSGEYVVEFYSIDLLGHAEVAFSIPGGIRIDNEAPRAPTPIDVAPRGWTNVNSFDLTLAMPPDLSGVAGLFYKVGGPPVDAADGTWRPGSSNILHDVETPGEGRFSAYVWLQDMAGNVDHTRRGVWENAISLAYDATPPTTTVELDGTPGANGWFISAVQATLHATDTLSGVLETTVSVNGAEPVNIEQITLNRADKHTLLFSSTDNAENVEPDQLATIRIDLAAPQSPRSVTTSPTGWTRNNSFTLMWSNPPDTSGIAGGYYKIGDPPVDAHDGTLISPVGISPGITVPAEGAWDIHFWLVDQAGNADLDSRVVRNSALRFDGTPPTTTATVLAGDLGAGGWYISPVTIQLAATDAASGVATLQYRLNEGEWTTSDADSTLVLDSTGHYSLDYQAVDAAGNAEPRRQIQIKLDLTPPFPAFEPVARYQRQSSFELAWNAADQEEGSGLFGFDLRSKDGRNGPWTIWGNSNVPDTGGRYFGSFGHRYFFSIRARDRAGNVSAWVELPWGVYVDRLSDGDFSGGAFGAWQHNGALEQSVITAPGPQNEAQFVAQLGTPAYGPNVPGQDIPRDGPGSEGSVPKGNAALIQTLRVPGADVLDHATLTFWYRIFTYDTVTNITGEAVFDTFDVLLQGPSGDWLALREGLPREDWVEGRLADLGWRYAEIPLPLSWAGEMVTIRIENWNRGDGRLNTWSQVTDLRLWEPYHLYLPLATGGVALSGQWLPPADIPARTHSNGLR